MAAEFAKVPAPEPGFFARSIVHELRDAVSAYCDDLPPAFVDWLAALHVDQGHVSGSVFGRCPLRFSRVVFYSSAFEFAGALGRNDGEGALIGDAIAADGGACDLWAWAPRSGRLASLLGRCGVDSEIEALRPRIDVHLMVHPSPLEWLQAGRIGVFIIDLRRAASLLRDAGPLACANLRQGQQLRAALTVAPPKIFAPNSLREAA